MSCCILVSPNMHELPGGGSADADVAALVYIKRAIIGCPGTNKPTYLEIIVRVSPQAKLRCRVLVKTDAARGIPGLANSHGGVISTVEGVAGRAYCEGGRRRRGADAGVAGRRKCVGLPDGAMRAG